jgi:hypothetical protein
VSLMVPGTPVPGNIFDWKINRCPAGIMDQIVIGNPIVNLTDPDPFITQTLDGVVMEPITVGATRNSFAVRNMPGTCELPPNPVVFIHTGGRYFVSPLRNHSWVNQAPECLRPILTDCL